MTRPEASDPVQEHSEIIFLDKANSVIDWRSSLDNLKRLSTERTYTTDMMKACLLKIVSKYVPDQHKLLSDKTPNQIAEFLLRLDSKIDKMGYYRSRIFAASRLPSEDLQSALVKITNLLDTVYPPADAANTPHRESILKIAILSFLPDEISVPLLADMQAAAQKCKALTYDQVRELAFAAEAHSLIKPTATLQFGRPIGSSPSPTYFQLNSMHPDAEAITYSRRRNEYTADLYPYHYSAPYLPDWVSGAQMAQRIADHPAAQQVPPLLHGIVPLPPGEQPPVGMQPPPPIAQPPLIPQPPPNQPGHLGAIPKQTHASERSLKDRHPKAPAPRPYPRIDYQHISPTTPVVQDDFGHLAIIQLADGSEQPHRLINIPADKLAALGTPLPTSDTTSDEDESAFADAYASPGYKPRTEPPVAPSTMLTRRQAQTAAQAAAAGAAAGAADVAAAKTAANAASRAPGAASSKPESQDADVNYMQAYRSRHDSRSSRDRRSRSKSPRSRDDYRSRSRGRKSDRRYPSRDSSKSRRYDSDRSRHGSKSRSPYRSYNDRSRSRQNYDSDRSSRRDDYHRDRSRDHQRSHSYRRSRSPSHNKSSSSNYRSHSNSRSHRSSSRGRSENHRSSRRDSRDRPTSDTRGRSPHKRSTSRGQRQSRDSSVKMRQLYPEMKRGYNCGYSYNPAKTKSCRKCSGANPHHEFACNLYERYNPDRCGMCEKYHHFAFDCKEVSKFPPTSHELNAVSSNPKN
jgi:hypothetical protein